jgi:hypothetical protein
MKMALPFKEKQLLTQKKTLSINFVVLSYHQMESILHAGTGLATSEFMMWLDLLKRSSASKLMTVKSSA